MYVQIKAKAVVVRKPSQRPLVGLRGEEENDHEAGDLRVSDVTLLDSFDDRLKGHSQLQYIILCGCLWSPSRHLDKTAGLL